MRHIVQLCREYVLYAARWLEARHAPSLAFGEGEKV